MLEIIEAKLHADVQGTCTGQYGFIIAVLEIIDVGPGIVLPGTGQAEFKTRYKAIVFKPFKGEVLDGVVTNVLRVSITSFNYGASLNLSEGWVLCRSRTSALFRFPTSELNPSSSHSTLKFSSAGSCGHAV